LTTELKRVKSTGKVLENNSRPPVVITLTNYSIYIITDISTKWTTLSRL